MHPLTILALALLLFAAVIVTARMMWRDAKADAELIEQLLIEISTGQ